MFFSILEFLTALGFCSMFWKSYKKRKSKNEYNLGNLICFSKTLNATVVLQYVLWFRQLERATGKRPAGRGRNSTVRRPWKSRVLSDTIRVTIGTLWASRKPGGHGGVFSGGPRRDVRRAARRDLEDDQRHDPRALVHHVFVLSRCLRFSLVRFFFVTSSSVRFSFGVQRSD